jgi:glycosyltransferase involved in cell wall biosynthesis
VSEPTLSVIVPNFNHARFLPRCLDALLGQSVPACEIIVVDDASTDNSRDVLSSLAQMHPTVKIYHNERNMGVNATMNRALPLAQGDYVFFTAADDEVRPGLFEKSLRLLRANPQAGLCTGWCEWRRTDTGLAWVMGAEMPKEPGYFSPADLVALGQSGRLMISNPSTIYRKAALIEAGGWIPELRWFTDWFGAFIVGFRHGICHVPEVLSTFNLSPTSYYHSVRSQDERRAVMLRLLELLESEPFADVAPRIGQSGILGAFGWPMLELVARYPEHRRFLTGAFVRRAGRRCAEVAGRRFFPDWLERWCLKTFYHA